MSGAGTIVFMREQKKMIPKWTPEIANRFWRAMYDAAPINGGGQDAETGTMDVEPRPVPPSPDDACRWLRQSFPLTERERALIAATIQHLTAEDAGRREGQ